MAKKPKTEAAMPEPLVLISRLLALSVVKGMDQDTAIMQLASVGFDNVNIAQLMGVSNSAVRGVRFRQAKKPRKPSNE